MNTGARRTSCWAGHDRLAFTATQAQAPAPQGGRGGRGGGLPGATAEQTQALMDMNTALAPLTAAATTARDELTSVAIADVKNEAGLRAAAEKLRTAELAAATARAAAFARLQSGPCKLNPEQVAALISSGGNLGGGRGGGRGPGGPGAAADPPTAPAPSSLWVSRGIADRLSDVALSRARRCQSNSSLG
jgi:hypothetical protein